MDRTNAERQRRYINRLKARVTNDADVAALRAEVAALKARNAELGRERDVAVRLVAARPPKAEPPPRTDEAYLRQIKGLTTQIKNLKTELHVMRAHYASVVTGDMPRATQIAIDKALHPDAGGNSEVCKLWNAWKTSRKLRPRPISD